MNVAIEIRLKLLICIGMSKGVSNRQLCFNTCVCALLANLNIHTAFCFFDQLLLAAGLLSFWYDQNSQFPVFL